MHRGLLPGREPQKLLFQLPLEDFDQNSSLLLDLCFPARHFWQLEAELELQTHLNMLS